MVHPETIRQRSGAFARPRYPYLDDVYTVARYLLRDPTDAEDAVQECYLRALKHFDSYRGPAMKPWLLAILRNVCNAEFAPPRQIGRRCAIDELRDSAEDCPLWQETRTHRKNRRYKRRRSIRRMIAALAEPFRETFVLREIQTFPIARSPRPSACR